MSMHIGVLAAVRGGDAVPDRRRLCPYLLRPLSAAPYRLADVGGFQRVSKHAVTRVQCMYMCVYICMYVDVCMHVCIYVCMYKCI